MKKYVLHRVLLIPLVLMILSMVTFALSKVIPQDPVISLLKSQGLDTEVIDPLSEGYVQVYHQLSLDKPLFYFSVQPTHYPRNIHARFPTRYYDQVRHLYARGYSRKQIAILLHNIRTTHPRTLSEEELHSIIRPGFPIPSLRWHGTDNQYHTWLGDFLQGRSSKSTITGRSVWDSVIPALKFTLVMSMITLVLTFIIGIYLGYYLARDREGRIQKVVSHLLYFLYSIPVFWLATMLVIFLTTDDYGGWTDIFPSVGINIIPQATTWELIWGNLEKFILPIFCILTYVVVYIARMLRRSILDQMSLPYITTAYSIGLTEKQVLRNHALPNALLPILTVLVGALSRSISGSVIIEVIFNIPGMGRLLYQSILSADWNVVFCIVMLTGTITAIAYLIGDILYAILDPRIRYGTATA